MRFFLEPFFRIFTYSLMLDEQVMVDRCPLATYAGRASLLNYRVVLQMDGRLSLERAVSGIVYGVLWLVDRNEILEIDYFEGVDSGKSERRLVNVVDLSEGTLRAEVHIPKPTATPQLGTAYLDAIIRAASKRALPESYIRQLGGLRASADQSRY